MKVVALHFWLPEVTVVRVYNLWLCTTTGNLHNNPPPLLFCRHAQPIIRLPITFYFPYMESI